MRLPPLYHWRVAAIDKSGVHIHCDESGELVARLLCDPVARRFGCDRPVPGAVYLDAIMTLRPLPDPTKLWEDGHGPQQAMRSGFDSIA